MIAVGQRVGNYDLTAVLGEGGMGTVFLAEHPVIGSKVALKAIHPQFARDAEVVSRFVTEAKAVNQIGHDHIVDITDFGTTPSGDFYFTMEHLEGESLAEAIKTGAPFPPARALNIAAQIADALSAAHEHGVIHRDLKPDNVFLLVRDGVLDFVKVFDFGLAKLTNLDEQVAHHSRTGSVMGTPYYMSPEQCEGKNEIDPRADVYALGVLLFEMLTGKVPFGGVGYGEILVKHITVRPPAARSIVPDLPPTMDLILARALAKQPDQRFATMADFRDALLNPESYAASTPTAGVHEDLSGRVRAAKPMSLSEMSLERPTTKRPSGKASGPSTFRDSIGEVWVRQDGPKPSHAFRNVFFAGLILIAGGVGSLKYGHQARSFVAATAASRAPVTVRVRVNFNSDPQGASVVGSDGVVLGKTPLSTEIPYGNTPVEFVLRLEGYRPKTTSIVPNLPSPLFAVLTPQAPELALDPQDPAADSPFGPPQAAAPPPAAPAKAPAAHRTHRRPKQDSEAPRFETDVDGVMGPSFR